MLRLIPATLLLLAAAANAAGDAAAAPIERRSLVALADPALVPQPKNLGVINERFESMANAAHEAVANMAKDPPSNDDPDVLAQLMLSVTINGTRLTQSPTTPPSRAPSSLSKTLAPSASSPQAPIPSPTPVDHTIEGSPPHSTASDGTVGNNGRGTPSEEDGDHTEATEDDATTNSTSFASSSPPASSSTALPKATVESPSSNADDEAEHAETSTPTSVFPTYSPSFFDTKAPIAPLDNADTPSVHNPTSGSASSPEVSDEAREGNCPSLYDESKQYREGDLVSIKRHRRCRGERCLLIFQCKPWPESSYCNLVPPSKRKSDKGWLPLGRCSGKRAPTSSPVEMPAEQDASSLSGAPTLSPVAEVGDREDGVHTENGTVVASNATDEDVLNELPPTKNDTVALPNATTIDDREQSGEKSHQPSPSPITSIDTLPTTSPTARRQFVSSPTWSKPDVDPVDSITVKLPRIICDITLSTSLAESFERNHVLMAAMTHIIYSLFDKHLPKPLYDLSGISLNVEVKRNEYEDTIDNEGAASEMVRVHADFVGTASFSLRGAPTSGDLTTLLIRHFDVDEFNDLLRQGPLNAVRARTVAKHRADDEIKVNSVFFIDPDGQLILAGSTYEENRLPTKTIAPGDRNRQSLQVTFVILALIAMACVLALVMFLFYSNKKREKEDEEEDIGGLASTDELPAAEDQSNVAVRDESMEVEIEVPSTPHMAVSDISEDNKSEVSSLSASPFPTKSPPSHCFNRGLDCALSATPSNSGLGISNPNRYQYVGNVDLEASWQQQQQQPKTWELYKDSSGMESP